MSGPLPGPAHSLGTCLRPHTLAPLLRLKIILLAEELFYSSVVPLSSRKRLRARARACARARGHGRMFYLPNAPARFTR